MKSRILWVALITVGAFVASSVLAQGESGGTAQVVELAVTSEGFVPSQVKVRAGKPVQLVVTRKTDRTCATEIVVRDYGVRKALPLNEPVTVTFTPKKPGQIRYSCGMDMIAGALTVE